ncbi:MAG: 8-amino-7-oxononanoate synthase [Capsulimonadaceae bacterium]|nr:8-amino-7-oxononanoate synthase [Capsulimonadaceae bacterium]
MADINVVLSGAIRDRQALELARSLPPSSRPPIDLGSNDYLGLARDGALIEAASRALRIHGTGSTGARLISGNLSIHEELEKALADIKSTAAALLFPSGYQAALGVIPALAGGGDLIVSDELNHACLIDGCRMSRATVRVYSHNSLESARSILADRRRFRRCLILTDGVFSMDGDIADLEGLAALRDEFDAWLMVDDAHGTGVLGATGAGSVELAGVASRVDVQMGTLSKALGSSGGFIAGSRVLIDYLINDARSFVYSTAPSPASSGAALAALEIVRREPDRRQRLSDNAAYLRNGLRSIGLPIAAGQTPIIPIVLGSGEVVMRMAAELQPRFGIAGIRPPTVPQGSSRLRVTVKATHTREQIDSVVEAFDVTLRRFGLRQYVLDGMAIA